MIQNIIGGLFMLGIGILLILNPHGVWALTERWKQAGAAQASPAFQTVARIIGGLCAVVGLLVLMGVLK